MSKQLLISLFNCSWQWMLLGGVTWLVANLLFHKSQHSNTTVHLLWLLSLFSLPILFGLNQFVPALSIGGVVPELTQGQSLDVPSLTSVVKDLPEALSTEKEIQSENQLSAEGSFFAAWTKTNMLLCLWGVGSFTMLIRFAIGLYRVHQLRCTATMADDSYQSICQRFTQRLNINRPVTVCFSDQIVSPISFGLLSPCILVPRGLNLDQFKLVTAHELAHVRRLDWLTNLFLHAVGAFFFFHPLYYFLNRRLVNLREQICDDWVVQLTGARKNYAQCLLDIDRYRDMSVPLALTLNQPSQLEARIDSILKRDRRLDLRPKRSLLLVMVTLFLGCLPLLAMAQLVPLKTVQLRLFSQIPQKSGFENPQAAPNGVDEIEKMSEKQHLLGRIKRSYDVKSGGSLKIASDYGTIDVQTAHRDTIEIVIKNESKSNLDSADQSALDDFEVAFGHKGPSVVIEGRFKQGWQSLQKNRDTLDRLRIRFQVTVPQQYSVYLQTSGGRISVSDLTGEVNAHTLSGSLNFGNIKGPVWGDTAGGSIKLASCDGSVTLKTFGGSIKVGNVTGNVDLHTFGGSIRIGDVVGDVKAQTFGGSLSFGKIQGSLWGKTFGGSIKIVECGVDTDVLTLSGSIVLDRVTGPVSAKTTVGHIVARLGSDAAFDVDAQTGNGRVSSVFPVVLVPRGKIVKNRLKGTINGGGHLLKLDASGGNIYLQSAKK